jgi:hypothetical protein
MPAKGLSILKRTTTMAAKTVTAQPSGCLNLGDAVDLVEHCIGGAPLSLSTKLSDFLPTDAARLLFCDRVKNAAASAGCTRPFPCATDTALIDIVNALKC